MCMVKDIRIDLDSLIYAREKCVSSCLFKNKYKISIRNSKSTVQYGVRKNIYVSNKKMIDRG